MRLDHIHILQVRNGTADLGHAPTTACADVHLAHRGADRRLSICRQDTGLADLGRPISALLFSPVSAKRRFWRTRAPNRCECRTAWVYGGDQHRIRGRCAPALRAADGDDVPTRSGPLRTARVANHRPSCGSSRTVCFASLVAREPYAECTVTSPASENTAKPGAATSGASISAPALCADQAEARVEYIPGYSDSPFNTRATIWANCSMFGGLSR